MTIPPPGSAPTNPFHYLNDADGGPPWYVVYIDHLPEVRAEEGTAAGQLTFRTPNGALAATGISTSERLFGAAAESLALAHAVAAFEDAQRDSERQAGLTAALADSEGHALVQAIHDRKLNR